MKKLVSVLCCVLMLCSTIGCIKENTEDNKNVVKEIKAAVEESEESKPISVLLEESESDIVTEYNKEDSYLAVDYLSLDFNGTKMLFPATAEEFCNTPYWLDSIKDKAGDLNDITVIEPIDLDYYPLVDIDVSSYMSGDTASINGIVDKIEMTISDGSTLFIFNANYSADSDIDFIIGQLGNPEEIRIDNAGTRYLLYSFGKGTIEFVLYPEQSTLGCIILTAIYEEPYSVKFGYEVVDLQIIE